MLHYALHDGLMIPFLIRWHQLHKRRLIPVTRQLAILEFQLRHLNHAAFGGKAIDWCWVGLAAAGVGE
jgi:hypothetical protein